MYKINSEYSNSRHINYNRWSKNKEVDALVGHLLVTYNGRKKASYVINMKVLVLELYQSYLSDKDQYIGFHRGKDHYKFKDDLGDERYTVNPHIAWESFVGSVDLLLEQGYITQKVGRHFYDEELGEYGFLSRMRATEALVVLWQMFKFTPDMIQKFRQSEVIKLKNLPIEKEITKKKNGRKYKIKIKKDYGYSDNQETKRMRKVVLEYNRQLDHAHIDCDAGCLSDTDRSELIASLSEYEKDPVIKVDLSSKNVYRVFNNRSFKQGGRFYGAWWIGCPSILRKYITINGEPTVELDYSGIHIHLLYAMKGINYAKRKEDSYVLDDGVPSRDLNKLILLTALNAETAEGARDSIYDKLSKADKARFNNKKLPITKKIELLKAKHEPIAEYIATGQGIKLQYYDSCIIEKLIIWGLKHDIAILTIHDSVVCQARYADLVKDKMWFYFSSMVKSKLKCNVKYTRYAPHARKAIQSLPVFNSKYRPPVDYIMKDELYQRFKPTTGRIKTLLTQDDIINITNETRTNICSGTCSHSKRIGNYKVGTRNYLGVIKVKLTVDGHNRTLSVTG
jgi:hypothetical protein